MGSLDLNTTAVSLRGIGLLTASYLTVHAGTAVTQAGATLNINFLALEFSQSPTLILSVYEFVSSSEFQAELYLQGFIDYQQPAADQRHQ